MFKSSSILTGCIATALAAGCSLTMGDMTLIGPNGIAGQGGVGGRLNFAGSAGAVTAVQGGWAAGNPPVLPTNDSAAGSAETLGLAGASVAGSLPSTAGQGASAGSILAGGASIASGGRIETASGTGNSVAGAEPPNAAGSGGRAPTGGGFAGTTAGSVSTAAGSTMISSAAGTTAATTSATGGLSALGGTTSAGGSSTLGGAVASGGSTTSQFALGHTCASGAQCASTYCVDGVCCDSSCNGACQACGSNGFCNVTPTTDSACPAVTCPTNTTCASYSAPAAGSCKSFGTCRTSNDCTIAPTAVRTSCATGSLCDGKGNCVGSQVKCGAETCDESYQQCCMLVDAGTFACQGKGMACGDSSKAADPNTGVSAQCDQDADCPIGELCCMTTNGSAVVSCWAADKCPGGSPYYSAFRICSTPAETIACPTGTTCKATQDVLSESWKTCQETQ
jgi:hypothetical protein